VIPIARPRLRANQNVVTLLSGTMIAPNPNSPIIAWYRYNSAGVFRPESRKNATPGRIEPTSTTRRTGSRSEKCPITIPPSPVDIVTTEYAAAISARGQPNSAASGLRNTEMLTIAPNAMPIISAQAPTITQAYGCSRSSMARSSPGSQLRLTTRAAFSS